MPEKPFDLQLDALFSNHVDENILESNDASHSSITQTRTKDFQ
jgi:hypothetical protein